MIKSMTAFAREQQSDEFGTLTWELRSVNSRYLDINCRLPEEFRAQEGRTRESINKRIQRGKIECGLRFAPEMTAETEIKVNAPLVKSLIDACQQINTRLHQPSEINPVDILSWPGVVAEAEQDFKAIYAASEQLLQKALDELVENRLREGERMRELILTRCSAMQDIVGNVRQQLPQIQQRYREKLTARLEELNTAVDQDRLEQELVFLAQKMDVDEELDRLSVHLTELCQVLDRDEAVGRRLDFLMQELNREANTLGSKSADIQTTQASVELKVLIEQMREQIQNIE
ncbi:MAG: YicC family protein [Gammaproteobacteria bacterium]|nr:YicC family protein [Gammaproteobacteria bacterium]